MADAARRWLWTFLALLVLLVPAAALAGPPPAADVSPDPERSASHALLDQSALVAAWLGGDLHPSIDPEAPFAIDLPTTRLTRAQLDLLRDTLAGEDLDPSRAGAGVKGCGGSTGVRRSQSGQVPAARSHRSQQYFH